MPKDRTYTIQMYSINKNVGNYTLCFGGRILSLLINNQLDILSEKRNTMFKSCFMAEYPVYMILVKDEH